MSVLYRTVQTAVQTLSAVSSVSEATSRSTTVNVDVRTRCCSLHRVTLRCTCDRSCYRP